MAAAVVVLLAGASLLGLGVVTHVVRGQVLLARFGDAPTGQALVDHLRYSWPVAIGLLVAGATIAWMGHRSVAVVVPLLVYGAPGIDRIWSAETLRPGIVTGVGAADLGSIGLLLAVAEAAVLVAPAVVIGRLASPAKAPFGVFCAMATAIVVVPVALGIWLTSVYWAADGRVDPRGATVAAGAVVAGFIAARSRPSAGLLLALSYALVVRRTFLPDPYPALAMGAFLAGMIASHSAEVFSAGWTDETTTHSFPTRRGRVVSAPSSPEAVT